MFTSSIIQSIAFALTKAKGAAQEKLSQKLDISTKQNLDMIAAYNQEINSYLNDYNAKIGQASKHAHVELLRDYQHWIQLKEKEYQELTAKVSQRAFVKDHETEIMVKLNQRLAVEEAKCV